MWEATDLLSRVKKRLEEIETLGAKIAFDEDASHETREAGLEIRNASLSLRKDIDSEVDNYFEEMAKAMDPNYGN